jgi:hypothetical protein
MVGFPCRPLFYPGHPARPHLFDLASPLGGNNRSVLSYKSNNPDTVTLNLELEKRTIVVGELLKLKVTFVNQDKGPVILVLPNQAPVITGRETVQAVTFRITPVTSDTAFDQPQRDYQPSAAFEDISILHVLGARARCSESYTITSSDLAALVGPGTGEFRIRAYYRNNSDGDLSAVTNLALATATPYPEYLTSQALDRRCELRGNPVFHCRARIACALILAIGLGASSVFTRRESSQSRN